MTKVQNLEFQQTRLVGHLTNLVNDLASANNELRVMKTHQFQTTEQLQAAEQRIYMTFNDLDLFKNKLNTTNELLHTAETDLRSTESRVANLSRHFSVMQSVVLSKHSATFSNFTVYKERVYLLSRKIRVNFEQHDITCRQLGGYLVEIDDKDEYDALVNFLSYLDKEFVMLSGTDEGHEGRWNYFRSERHVTYLKWGSNEPNNGDTWNCLELYTGDMLMKDYPCLDSAKYRFLCEIP